ncbi:MAG: tyrosine-protein phosphatase [Erysipelotrichaceae bacterium]
MENIRRIKTPHITNLRDLGGYEINDTNSTAYHVFYRSNSLCAVGQEDVRKLKRLGIKTIIDLRSTQEIKNHPYSLDKYFTILKCPLLKEEGHPYETLLANQMLLRSMSSSYVLMLEESKDMIVELVKVMATQIQEGAVLFHCTAGKDRTGLIAALLLKLVGCSDEDIICDYQISETYIENDKMMSMYQLPSTLLSSSSRTMKEVLYYVEDKHYLDQLMKSECFRYSVEQIKFKFVKDMNE